MIVTEIDFLQVDTERKCVRRNPDRPIPEYNEVWRNNVAQRTIYVKGFPLESTLDDILKFMQTFGKIDNVFVRGFFFFYGNFLTYFIIPQYLFVSF